MNIDNDVISERALVTDIVLYDYRTAEVFARLGIDFCCGGKLPLYAACEMKGLKTRQVIADLHNATKNITISQDLPFNEWDMPFLTDFIVNIHHAYLKKAIPVVKGYVKRFAEGHQKKMPGLRHLPEAVDKLAFEIIPSLQREEQIFFPYIKQLAHAHSHKEPYASLMVRTLRKPLQVLMQQHASLLETLSEMRRYSENYHIPVNACVTHRVTQLKLKELDNDLQQHLYLENSVLLPKAILIENELLDGG
jgi:regulator of cell morphogenesis and NO signaling